MILWCGGEDVDFPVGAGTVTISTSTGVRSPYSRSAVNSNSSTESNYRQSKPFQGGAITSAWLSCRYTPSSSGGNFRNNMVVGVSLSTTAKGLYIGTDATTALKLALFKYDGTTKTSLATESGASLVSASSPPQKVDMQIVNYGASATVNVFLDGILVITYSGDVTVTGMSNFDSVTMPGKPAASLNNYVSEVVVADEDTRPLLGLLTMAPTATGTTNNWTNNTVTNVNPTTITDANATSSNTNAQDQQYNVTDEPSGTFVVKAVKIAARAWNTVGATANHIKLGFNSGGSVAAGTSQATSTSATTYEQLWDANNPVTSAAWGDVTEINALQINLRAST